MLAPGLCGGSVSRVIKHFRLAIYALAKKDSLPLAKNHLSVIFGPEWSAFLCLTFRPIYKDETWFKLIARAKYLQLKQNKLGCFKTHLQGLY
jgi:hypothetical protein